ncbi:hypothetical protein NL676_008534 [Syzygium grande]|nr:hypothetical protein NL676_008534 [Syzygium grande]
MIPQRRLRFSHVIVLHRPFLRLELLLQLGLLKFRLGIRFHGFQLRDKVFKVDDFALRGKSLRGILIHCIRIVVVGTFKATDWANDLLPHPIILG